MNEIVKLQALISFLDSYKFGGYNNQFMDNYIETMIDDAESDLLECLLIIKFNGLNIKEVDKYISMVKSCYKKVRDKYS